MRRLILLFVLIITLLSISISYASDYGNTPNKIVAIEEDNVMTIVMTPDLESNPRSPVIPRCKFCGTHVNIINRYQTVEHSYPECDLGHTNCTVNQLVYYDFSTYQCSNCGSTYSVRTWIRTYQTHNYS